MDIRGKNRSPTAKLVLVSCSDKTHPRNSIVLYDERIIIGRGTASDLQWTNLQFSRKHATLEYINNKWFIQNHGVNAVRVGDVRLDKDGPFHELKDGDEVCFIPEPNKLAYRFERLGARRTLRRRKAEVILLSVESESESDDSSLLSVRSIDDMIDMLSDADSHPSPPPPLITPKQVAKQTVVIPQLIPTPTVRGKRAHGDDPDSDALKEGSGKRKKGSPSPPESSPVVIQGSEVDVQSCSDPKVLRETCVQLRRMVALRDAEIEDLRGEKVRDGHEAEQKIRAIQRQFDREKQEIHDGVLAVVEQEFNCCICSEIFIHPAVSDCGHTFCRYCIAEWAKKRHACPLCNTAIKHSAKHVEMDNFIEQIHLILPEKVKSKRAELVRERLKAENNAFQG